MPLRYFLALSPFACDKTIRFFLYLLVFWLPYSNAAVESCVIVSSVLWIFKRWLLLDRAIFTRQSVRKKIQLFLQAFRPSSGFLNIPIAIFILACLLSVSSSAFFERSLSAFITKTFEWFVVYFLLTETITEKRHARWILNIFIFTAISTCLDGIMQFHITQRDFFNARTIEVGNGATAGFSTPNDLGGFLTFVTPLTFFMALSPKKYYLRALWIVIFSIALWAALITFSRGTWVAIIGGILAILFFENKKLFSFLFGTTALLLGCYLLFSLQIEKISRINWESIYNFGLGRLDIWLDSYKLILERPVFGHGINTYMMLFQEYRTLNFNPTYAHNCYIQMWVEIGLVGLGSFWGIMIALARGVLPKISKSSTLGAEGQTLLKGLSAGISAFLIHSFFDTNFYSLQLSVLFWVMVGYLVAVARVLNR